MANQRVSGDPFCTPKTIPETQSKMRTEADFNSINLIPIHHPARERVKDYRRVPGKGGVQKGASTDSLGRTQKNIFRPTCGEVWREYEVRCNTISQMSTIMDYGIFGVMTLTVNGMLEGGTDHLHHTVRVPRGRCTQI